MGLLLAFSATNFVVNNVQEGVLAFWGVLNLILWMVLYMHSLNFAAHK